MRGWGEWKIWPSVSPIYQKQRQEAGRWGWLGLHPCPPHRVTQVFTFSFSSSLTVFSSFSPTQLAWGDCGRDLGWVSFQRGALSGLSGTRLVSKGTQASLTRGTWVQGRRVLRWGEGDKYCRWGRHCELLTKGSAC